MLKKILQLIMPVQSEEFKSLNKIKKVKIRKPKNRKERIEWSCLGAILFTFAAMMITALALVWLGH